MLCHHSFYLYRKKLEVFVWIGSSLEPGSVTVPVWVPCNKFGTLINDPWWLDKVTSVSPLCLEGKCGLLVIATLKCPDSYLEILLLQIKGHFYCTDSSVAVTVTECICSVVSIVNLAIELHLGDAHRQNNDRCRSIQSGFSLWDAGQEQSDPLCQVAKNKVHVWNCRTYGLVCLQPKTKWELSFTQGWNTAPDMGTFFKSPHGNILVLWEHQIYFPPPPLLHLLPLMNF